MKIRLLLTYIILSIALISILYLPQKLNLLSSALFDKKSDYAATFSPLPIEVASSTAPKIEMHVSASSQPTSTPAKNSFLKNITETPPPSNKATSSLSMPSLISERKILSSDIIYKQGIEKIVNMFCSNGKGEYIIATGAIIHPNGYVLSNAHVAADLPMGSTCDIRRGSPSVPFATAKLVLVPSIYAKSSDPQTQAHNDVSIWKIENMQGPLPFWTIDESTKTQDEEKLLTLSYPAELLGSQLILKGVNLLFSETTVTASDAVLIKSRATISAQQGSSGGVLIDHYTGFIRGLMFAIDKEAPLVSDRNLYSITPHGINEAIKKETGKTLKEYLAGNPS